MPILKNKWILRSIGILLFIIILSRIDLFKSLELLSNVNIYYLLLAILMFFPVLVLKALRWQTLMKAQGISYPLKDTVLMYAAGLLAGGVTPGKVGDFSKVFYLANEENSFGKSFVSVFLDKLFDLSLLTVLVYLSMFAFIIYFKNLIIALSAFIMVAFFIFFVLITKKEIIKMILTKIFKILVPEKFRKAIKLNFYDFYNDIKLLKFSKLILASVVTILAMMIYFTQCYLIALSLDINIPFLYLVICMSIASIVTLIPISILGIGTRDVTLIVLFSYIGLNKESAIAFSVMCLFVVVISYALGFIAWLIKPIPVKWRVNEKMFNYDKEDFL